MGSSDPAFEKLYDDAIAAKDVADFRTQERLARELIALCEARANRSWLAPGNLALGQALAQRNDGSGSMKALREALVLFREFGDSIGEARCLMAMGATALDVDLDGSAARQYYDESIGIVRHGKDRRLLGVALGNLGEIDRIEGNYRAALRHADESLEIFRALGDHARSGWQLVNTAHYHALQRNYGLAVETLRKAFAELTLDPNSRWLAWYFDVCIILAASAQRWETVARLRGFTDRFRDERNIPRLQAMLPWLSRPFEDVWRHLPQDRVNVLLLEGESYSVSQANAMALDGAEAV